MVGHTTIPGYSKQPSSQSRRVIEGLLVDELGFDGLIVSDALGMAASGEPTQGGALVGFIAAGGDLGIVGPGGSVEGRRALRRALEDGTVTQERLNDAAAAVLAAKGIDPCDVTGVPAPEVEDSEVPSDPAVSTPRTSPDRSPRARASTAPSERRAQSAAFVAAGVSRRPVGHNGACSCSRASRGWRSAGTA